MEGEERVANCAISETARRRCVIIETAGIDHELTSLFVDLRRFVGSSWTFKAVEVPRAARVEAELPRLQPSRASEAVLVGLRALPSSRY